MLISEKQQQANQQNAQHSTGPKTAAGKAAVRLNALKYGLRARDLLLPHEDPAEYQQLWDDLETEWKPQTRSERTYLVQMATSEWLLARLARGENLIYQADLPLEKQLALLREVSTQRARLERSFTTAIHELQQLQKDRQAHSQPKQVTQPRVPAKHPTYPIETEADPPVYRAQAATETP